MKDWKTTAFGLVSALGSFILFSPGYFPDWSVDLAKFILAGGLIGFGISAADFRKKI